MWGHSVTPKSRPPINNSWLLIFSHAHNFKAKPDKMDMRANWLNLFIGNLEQKKQRNQFVIVKGEFRLLPLLTASHF